MTQTTKRMRIIIEVNATYPAGNFNRKGFNTWVIGKVMDAFPLLVYCETEIADENQILTYDGKHTTDACNFAAPTNSPWGG